MQDRARLSKPTTEGAGAIAVDRETFKSIFYMLSGRPDSKSRTFERRIVVTSADLYDLNRRVQEKLRLHNISECTAKVSLKLGRDTTIDFGLWKEFEEFDWHRSTSTAEVTLRWDFLLDLEEFRLPQRHTLAVRIAATPGPRGFLRIVVGQRLDDDEESPFQLGPCVARVDFISHRLADELIDVVAEWNKCVTECQHVSPMVDAIENYDDWIARAIHYSTPVFVAVAAWTYFVNMTRAWTSNAPGHIAAITQSVQWLFGAGLSVYVASILSGVLATLAFKALNEYGRFSPFNLTTGDKHRRERHVRDNRRTMRKFVVAVVASVAVNIISNAVTARCTGWLGSVEQSVAAATGETPRVGP